MTTTFNSTNSDIKVRSIDGIEFDLHRTLLGANTGAFPGPEIDTGGQVVNLSETAEVLRICFDFVYPKRHPDLEDVASFELLAAVAEAVGKYEIFSAMNTCNTRFRAFLPQYATEIFVYAIKHDHPKLINEAVPYLARSPFIPVLKQIPPAYVVPWSRYYEAWLGVFKAATKYIKDLSSSSTNQCHSASGGFSFAPSSDTVCNTCRCSLFIWVSNLEDINDVASLNNALQNPYDKAVGLQCCVSFEANRMAGTPFTSYNSKPEHRCTHILKLAKLCQDLIKALPPFSAYIEQNQ